MFSTYIEMDSMVSIVESSYIQYSLFLELFILTLVIKKSTHF